MQSSKQTSPLDPTTYTGEEKAKMEALYADTMKDFSEGSVVHGKILEVRDNDVLVDIGYKSEGLIPKSEFKQPDELQPGDDVEVLLECLEDDDGMVILSKQRAELQRNWQRMLTEFNEGDIIEGEITGQVKGGLLVDVGVEAFLPGSQVDVVPVRNAYDYIGKTMEFKILKINEERRNIVLSRRELLEESRRDQKKALLTEIKAGQVRKGIVKNITDFGAFIDLNGMDGLLHITDISWGRVNHPSDVLSIGQEVEVMILDVDLDRERISLGLKQNTANPWEGLEQRFPVNSQVRGKVVNLMPYGAFIEIEEGVEGMVHVSEMSWTKRVARASDVLSVGQVVDAVVLSINKNEQKISLGIRQTEDNPWDVVAQSYPIGSRVSGTVRNFTNYGAFVELQEGVDGMIHVSDMSWTRKINHPSEVLKKGDHIDAVVLEVDASQQRISLGLKQAQEDPWSAIASKYTIGQKVSGKVSKLASFGAFVELEEGIDGLVHISQISDERVQKVKEVLSPGQEVEARVIKIDPVERRIGLSIKAAEISDEEFKVDDDMLQGLLKAGEDLVSLGGAFEEAFSDAQAREWHPGEK